MGRRRGLVGTVAASEVCQCGHNRISHRDKGHGPCTWSRWETARDGDGIPHPTLNRCTCTHHRTKEN